jgi:hypothetical protein
MSRGVGKGPARPQDGDQPVRREALRAGSGVVAFLAGHLQPTGQPAALGGRAGLVEALIHHQDIRRALAAPRSAERLLPALRTAMIALDVGGLWRIRGLRLVATDLGSSFGAGPEVRGHGRGAADDRGRTPRRGSRAIRPGPAKARSPHRRLAPTTPDPGSEHLRNRPVTPAARTAPKQADKPQPRRPGPGAQARDRAAAAGSTRR